MTWELSLGCNLGRTRYRISNNSSIWLLLWNISLKSDDMLFTGMINSKRKQILLHAHFPDASNISRNGGDRGLKNTFNEYTSMSASS
jgi:hypothetical protein